LLTFGALLSIKTDNTASCVVGLIALASLLPSFLYALFAVTTAIHERRPRYAALLPSVKYAVESCEFKRTAEKTEVNLYLIYYPICEATAWRTLQKAGHVERAHLCYSRAIALLTLPVVAIVLSLIVLIVMRMSAS
jgi:hypothetical protein